MQRYITHLLLDLETATRNAPAFSNYRFRHPFDNEEADAPAYQLRYIQLNELFGLPTGAFPPSERLTKVQLTALLTAIEGLWRAWAIYWECPPRLTARRRYTVMVETMEQESLPYNYELGARINFCARHSENICPFNDLGQCSCKQIDPSAEDDNHYWERNRDFQQTEQEPNTPLEEFQKWVNNDKPAQVPWEMEDDDQEWKDLLQDEDSLSWLFFFDQSRNQGAIDNADQQPSPEDYEDFDWHNEEDDLDDLPF